VPITGPREAGGGLTAEVTLAVRSDSQIADSVREIGEWVESLIDSQINLIWALLETASLGDAPG